MAAGVHGRASRSLRDVASLPGWLQLVATLAVAAVIAALALLAGLGEQYLPLVVGGTLAALVAGAPRREED
jgi:hypothetical protein